MLPLFSTAKEAYNNEQQHATRSNNANMGRRNLTTVSAAGFTEARQQLEEISERIASLEQKLKAAKIKDLEVPHFANFTEALRLLHVFAGGAEECLAGEKLRRLGGE